MGETRRDSMAKNSTNNNDDDVNYHEVVEDGEEEEEEEVIEENGSSSSRMVSSLKLMAACAIFWSALTKTMNSGSSGGGSNRDSHLSGESTMMYSKDHRRLQAVVGDSIPTYMDPLMKDLQERKQLFDETPPEEVKYWFEYTGPLQKYFYRFSKSRGKADYFEGRDDSGVVSSRFIEEEGGGAEYSDFFMNLDNVPEEEMTSHVRLLENCLSMGSPTRPNTAKGTVWNDWFGGASSAGHNDQATLDRCRILFTINTVGAGQGTTILWETAPPKKYTQGPQPWMSEQETAAIHLERNLKEINWMCATGQIAARLQLLTCEPIPARWTEWMDSMLVNCGGKPAPLDANAFQTDNIKVEERASPVQVVVVASASTADTCHDLKSGFMEKRMQDLILAPPYLNSDNKDPSSANTNDPTVKMTHPDLISSDDHDLYVAMKWSSLVTIRAVHSFLQASADIAAAAASPEYQTHAGLEKTIDGDTVAISNSPSSPFLIPSFVRASYVSEENSKVAKWRMHGDFFHPAAWEICKDSYDMTWIPHSLSGSNAVSGMCYDKNAASAAGRQLSFDTDACGQWWVFFAELQMPTSPEVYANEVTPPIVEGGSNFFWMITERQRREIVKGIMCQEEKKKANPVDSVQCPKLPQAVMPLGDLESFLINFTPNTALGKKHVKSRRPGYSKEHERELDRQRVRERKQLHDQEDIEKALFDYTIYPAALFRKDATIGAARARDAILTSTSKHHHHHHDKDASDTMVGPQTVKSSYYDVTITKPREPTLGWCQAIARKGLCTLYADYFRTSNDDRCTEACGMKKNWTPISKTRHH